MKKMVLLIAAACMLTAAQAQDSIKTASCSKHYGVFGNLDVSVVAGTTGIGIDVASRIGDYVQLRAGYDYMPRFHKSIYFPVEVGGEPAKKYDAQGNRVKSRFDRLSEILTQVTGYQVTDEVEMVGKPTVNNFKLLVDVFPFKHNRHWHFTAGFYWGPSQFGYAENSTQAMTSLLAVGMYNTIYYRAENRLPLYEGSSFSIGEEIRSALMNYGRMGFPIGKFKHDIYGTYAQDVYGEFGSILHHKGEYGVIHQAGETYMMEPGLDGMVKVYAKANNFKPYLGFGYGGRLLKNRDDWQVSFDAGAMFWGGTPDLYTHDGINLTKDVEGIRGKVGDWVDIVGGVKVYPVLNVRFTKTIF